MPRDFLLCFNRAYGFLVYLPPQTPGAFGWLLVAGAVAAAPVLGAVQTGTVYRRASLKAFLSGAEAVGAAWLVAQYAVDVWWVRVSWYGSASLFPFIPLSFLCF